MTIGSPLSRWRLTAYSLPSLATSVVALPLALFIPAYYASDLGMPLATVGAAIALSRLLDVVSDPIIGVLSDRVNTRFGRRRVWMVVGVPVFLLALWKIFVPGPQVSFSYLLAWSACLYIGFTLIDLPHKAWGAELSDDYDERSRVTGWREACSTLGQVGLLAVLTWLAARGIDDDARQLNGVAVAVCVTLPILIAICVILVPDRRPGARRAGFPGPWAGLMLIVRNDALRRMVGCVLLFVSGVVIQGTLHRLVLADVMGSESLFPVMLLLENLATLACIPAWYWLSLRVGKHRALIMAALWIAAWSLPLVWLRAGDVATLLAIVAIRGSSFASILFLANSMAADVIDVDALESGERRSGLYFAIWGMVIKLSLALGVLLGTTLPSLVGYNPASETIDPPVQSALMLIYGAVPALLMALGTLFLRGFPVTRERHQALQAKLRGARSA